MEDEEKTVFPAAVCREPTNKNHPDYDRWTELYTRYLIVSVDPLKMVFQLLSKKEIVMNLHLVEIMFSSVSNTLFTQLSLRNGFPVAQFFGVIAYLAGAYGLSVLAFNKRELEF